VSTGAISAGILVYRQIGEAPEFLLAHPGGPFWKNRDMGAWSIPKGLVDPGETVWQAALREFQEETGLAVAGAFQPLTAIRQKAGKTVLCWAVEADLDLTGFRSGEFEIEWPPRSGQQAAFRRSTKFAISRLRRPFNGSCRLRRHSSPKSLATRAVNGRRVHSGYRVS
jgi:predicted NUDIX family NTP pyrophosphohydrolase